MKRSKWDLLKLIQDHQGRMTWYPIDTFFPIGSLAEDRNANGMDFVTEFLEAGWINRQENETGEYCYEITDQGREELNDHIAELTSQ
ncbi:MAG: hypothetical protein J5I93_23285 [Pirellulaceae bacterium]|nr:hypothetical protein [Pirellulaceae bacterium]